MYDNDAENDRTSQEWFIKFCKGDFSIADMVHIGRPFEVYDDQIETLIGSSLRYTTREIVKILKVSSSTVFLHLKNRGVISRSNVWGFHMI